MRSNVRNVTSRKVSTENARARTFIIIDRKGEMKRTILQMFALRR